jgi:two-component system chemotaxis response regulator CheY
MRRILVVDDSPVMRSLYRHSLARLGCSLAFAADGDEGLRKVAEEECDLIILDINMPGVDGFSILKRLRTERGFGRIRVIVVSTEGKATDVKAALEAGADAHVTKPFRAAELVPVVELLLESNDSTTVPCPPSQALDEGGRSGGTA